MENEFANVMSKKSDEQLIEIVSIRRDDYQPLAVTAAEDELKKRNINLGQIEEIKKNIIEVTARKEENNLRTVSKLTRLLNFIIDEIAIGFVMIILGCVVSIFQIQFNSVLGTLLLLISFLLYYIFMEYKFGKTIGKYLTKTKVVKINGEGLKLGDIVRRTLFRLIPLDGFSYLFSSSGLHDRLSDTILIKEENNL